MAKTPAELQFLYEASQNNDQTVIEQFMKGKAAKKISFIQRNKIRRIKEGLSACKTKLMTELANTTPHPYKVPPLIFFVAHTNQVVLQLIVKNFELLKQLGYSRLCNEFDSSQSLVQVIKIYRELVQSYAEGEQIFNAIKKPSKEQVHHHNMVKLNTQKVIQPNLKFLESVLTQSWLKYVGLDPLSDEDRAEDLPGLLEIDGSIDDMREDCFALNILTESNNTSGGTITIVGLGHNNLQKKLQTFSKRSLQNYLFVEFNPLADPEDIGPDSQKILDSLVFLSKPVEIDTTKGFDKANEIFQKFLREKIAAILSTAISCQYVQQLKSNETCILRDLQNLLNLSFIGGVDKDYYVDALLPVKDQTHYETVLSTIKHSITLNIAPQLIKDSFNNLTLIIPRINAENAKPIEAASIQKAKEQAIKKKFG